MHTALARRVAVTQHMYDVYHDKSHQTKHKKTAVERPDLKKTEHLLWSLLYPPLTLPPPAECLQFVKKHIHAHKLQTFRRAAKNSSSFFRLRPNGCDPEVGACWDAF